MAYLGKDQVEIQKAAMELPKVALTIITFFATATAFVMRMSLPLSDAAVARLSRIGEIHPYVNFFSANAETFAKVIYLITMVMTIYFFYFSYNFIAQVVANVTSSVEDSSTDTAMESQLDELLGKTYTYLKTSFNIVITLWASLLALFIVIL